jgi:hypothetical protein
VSYTPKEASVAIDTSNAQGKIADVAATGWLEAASSLGNPVDTAKEMIKTGSGHIIPSADITPEEVEILRQQHLKNKEIDRIIEESLLKQAEMMKRLTKLEEAQPGLEQQLIRWDSGEKQRVRASLIGECEHLYGDDS